PPGATYRAVVNSINVNYLTVSTQITISQLDMGSGFIDGSGALTVTGPTNWAINGGLDGPGTVNFVGDTTATSPFNTNGVRVNGGRRLNLLGPTHTFSTQGGFRFALTGGSVLTVGPGGTLVNT